MRKKYIIQCHTVVLMDIHPSNRFGLEKLYASVAVDTDQHPEIVETHDDYETAKAALAKYASKIAVNEQRRAVIVTEYSLSCWTLDEAGDPKEDDGSVNETTPFPTELTWSGQVFRHTPRGWHPAS